MYTYTYERYICMRLNFAGFLGLGFSHAIFLAQRIECVKRRQVSHWKGRGLRVAVLGSVGDRGAKRKGTGLQKADDRGKPS